MPRVVEIIRDGYERLNPQRQKAVEYFYRSGIATGFAGLSVIPVVEDFHPRAGLLSFAGGATVAVTQYYRGLESWDAGEET